MGDLGYWKLTQTEEDMAWQFQFDKLLADVLNGMREHEERVTLHIVIEYLRAKGYTVIKPNASPETS